jgi:uncharacterized protein YndB with AHSA1/START domain
MSEISHDMVINANCATVYQALTTAEGLRAWFTLQANGTGKVGTSWKLEFIDQPSFNWHILATEDQHRVVWKCLEGPGNAPGTEVEFSLKSESKNQTKLSIHHRGWTKGDPKFERCVEIWRTLMNHLQRYCETGIAEPAYH